MNGGERSVVRDRRCVDMGQYLPSRNTDVGQGGDGKTDKNAGDHPDHTCIGSSEGEKSGVGKRREDIAASGISVLHPVFYRSKRDHNGGSGCRRSGRSISSDERSVQVLYRDGDGSDRSSDRCSKTDQKRCETNFDGIVLLDRDYIGVVGTAACYEYLVNDFLRGSRDSMIV